MRIFLTLHPSANLSIPESYTWYDNLYKSLVDLGHDVYLLRLDEFSLKFGIKFRGEKFKNIFSEQIIKIFQSEHEKKHFDLFFTYLTDIDIDVSALELVKKIGVPMANFSCNNIHQFYLVEKISPVFDFNLHSEKYAGNKFKAIGAKPIWFPLAANPTHYFPKQLAYKYDVTFIGAAYAKRNYYISHLLNNDINIQCYGPNWKINPPKPILKKAYKEIKRTFWLIKSIFTLNPEDRYLTSTNINYYDLQVLLREKYPQNVNYPLKEADRITMYNQSKINLGFLEVYSENNASMKKIRHHLHLREFEVPMCRGLYMTNFSDELCEFYEPDKEILVFHNEHELIDKIRYYLKHDADAEIIREGGYQRALKCHTYQKRFADLFMQLNL